MVSTVIIKIISYEGTTIRDLGGKNQKSNLVVFITKTKKRKKAHDSGAIESAETTKHNYFRLRFLKT